VENSAYLHIFSAQIRKRLDMKMLCRLFSHTVQKQEEFLACRKQGDMYANIGGNLPLWCVTALYPWNLK
jgi:hypothetical protein